jgi:hypothetical protein
VRGTRIFATNVDEAIHTNAASGRILYYEPWSLHLCYNKLFIIEQTQITDSFNEEE